MKISFYVNLAQKEEGRTKIVHSLKAYLESKSNEVVFNDQNADIIHIHSSGISPTFLIKKLKKKRIPIIFSLYSIGESDFILTLKSIIRDTWFYLIKSNLSILSMLKHYPLYLLSILIPLRIKGYKLKSFDKVVVPSVYLQKKLFPNTEVIHLGINVNKFKRNKKRNKKLIVGYVGHFSDFKGVYEVIKASKEFSKDFETHFYFNTFATKVKLRDLQNIVHRYNKKAKVFGTLDDISGAYNKIDILIYPIKSPISAVANPLVLLEAMASECAIVTTKIPNVMEIVKNSAILINPDPKEIVKAVNKLKNKELRLKLGKKARKIIIEGYDEKIMFEKYLNLYNDLHKNRKI